MLEVKRLKIAHGKRIIADVISERALRRLEPPKSVARTLDKADWLSAVWTRRVITKRSTPALWSETSKNEITNNDLAFFKF